MKKVDLRQFFTEKEPVRESIDGTSYQLIGAVLYVYGSYGWTPSAFQQHVDFNGWMVEKYFVELFGRFAELEAAPKEVA